MTATFNLWHKHMRKFFRNPEAAFGMLLQPILWVVLFGIGMQAMLSMGSSMQPALSQAGSNYIGFMVPGIIMFSALSGAISGGATLLDERLRGVMKEYLVAPIPRYSILLANALSTVTKGLFQSLIILVLALFFGSQVASNPLGWLGGLLVVTFYGLGVAGLALAVAARVNSTLGYHGLIALDLPLLFASNALYPLDVLPGWMQWIARLNPTTYAIDAIRRLVYGIQYEGQTGLWFGILVVVLFSAFGMLLAVMAFRGEVKRHGGAA
jgi:ABC-2 type transport system permease protein